MFLKNKNIIFKIRRSKVTDYAALNSQMSLQKLEINQRNYHIKINLIQYIEADFLHAKSDLIYNKEFRIYLEKISSIKNIPNYVLNFLFI